MKIVRYKKIESSSVKWGCLEGDMIHTLIGDPLKNPTQGPQVGKLQDNLLMAPCQPTKVIAAAINYHGATDWEPGMTEPLFFLKLGTSVCSPSDPIVSYFSDVPTWGEAELAIVIGKRVQRATEAEAAAAILGYTVANDASAENYGKRDHHLARSKAADSFCPLGPYIDTDYDPTDRMIEGFHNDKLVRKGSTKDLYWGPNKIVHWLSSWMTLEPWDVILTGSPPLQGPLTYFEDGDTFTACVNGFPPIKSAFKQAVPLSADARNKFFKE